MVETQEQPAKKVHHGRNVKAGRIWKNVTQDQLGEQLHMLQCEISTLEKKEQIDKKLLDEIAKYLDIDISFLETFIPEDVLGTYPVNNDDTTFENTVTDHSTEEIIMGNSIGKEEHINNSLPFNQVKEYIDALLAKTEENAAMRILLMQNGIEFPPKGK